MIDVEKLATKKRFKWLTAEEKTWLEENFPWTVSSQEAVFCLKNRIESPPTCNYRECCQVIPFKGHKGYPSGCCTDHTRRTTNIEKYGVENPKQNREIIEKAKHTYNSKSDVEKTIIQKKRESTNMTLYGVKNPSYCPEVVAKISKINTQNAITRIPKLKQQNLEKYGVENVFQMDRVKEKIKQTLQSRYGVSNPSGFQEFKQKKIDTCMENYGVRHPQHDVGIFEKTQKHRYKDYTFPSGKTIKIQGYEHFALDELMQTYSENEIVCSRADVPKIWYYLPESDSKHQYIPDIFIPSENRCIEVKSKFTLNKCLELNLLKARATHDAGFNFNFMVFDMHGHQLQVFDSIMIV